jgi:hypothetical protein
VPDPVQLHIRYFRFFLIFLIYNLKPGGYVGQKKKTSAKAAVVAVIATKMDKKVEKSAARRKTAVERSKN